MTVFDGTIYVNECYKSCPFFDMYGDDLMECIHPFFNSTCIDPMDNDIITEENSIGNIPEKCPLKFREYHGNITIKLCEEQ
jgi:hypothetical protein